MSELRLDAETHTYHLGERILPGVTTTIRQHVPTWGAEQWYLDRGKALHAAVHLHFQGKLDWKSVDERIKGRLEAVLRFLQETAIRVDKTEVPLHSRRYQFAGTVDMIGHTISRKVWIADWKSTLSPEVHVQLGAYSLLGGEEIDPVEKAVAVEVHDDGTYKCRWFSKAELRAGAQTFLAMLSVSNWLKTNKLERIE